MGASSFQQGVTVEIDQRPYQLLRKLDNKLWQLEDVRTKRIVEYTVAQLRRLYANEKLLFPAKDLPIISNSQKEIGDRHQDISDDIWKVIVRRRAYVHAVLDIPHNVALMKTAIQFVSKKLGDLESPPSHNTVYRWKKKYLAAGRDIRSLIPAYAKRGNRKDRYPTEVVDTVNAAIEKKYLTEERGTIQDAVDMATALINRENKLRPNAMQLPVPTRRLVKRMIDAIPAFDKYAARYGRGAANKKFRSVQSHRLTSTPLERAEIDHTQLDLMVIDDKTGLPLGRPYVTACIDDDTRCVLGLHIGFEPPSYQTVAQCLKNAFLPKPDIREKYPSIVNEWDPHGVMRELVVDNGAEFHSKSLENACYSLGIEIHYSARKTPWFKGKIERFLGTFNSAVSHGVPGTTFSNIFEKQEYNPAKHAVIRYSVLQEIAHKWIVDVYHQQPHRTLRTPPAMAWSTRIDQDDILLPDDPTEMDAILGRSEERQLTHKGIELNGLQYNSPELTALRLQLGDVLTVDIRVNDADLGDIIVLSPDKTRRIKANALKQDYARGLSAWQHKVCKRYAAHVLEKHDPSGWLEAKLCITEMIDNEFLHKRRRSNAKVARFKEGKPVKPSPGTNDAVSAPSLANKQTPVILPSETSQPPPMFEPIFRPRLTTDLSSSFDDISGSNT